ncbi:MAG: hypothetical protein SGPRY_012801 [Prymnesium sp.]
MAARALLLAAAVAALLLWVVRLHHELLQLRREKLSLALALRHAEQSIPQPRHEAEADASALASAAGAKEEEAEASPLLALHRQWDFKMMVAEMLSPFDHITKDSIRAGVASCFQNGTMYCARAQVVNNQLFITDYRAIFFDRQYAPSRIMPLLSLLRDHSVPDVDLVIAANDEPRIKVANLLVTTSCG